jgi:HAE1 family hydrophobic/amphiphilic exporter-1
MALKKLRVNQIPDVEQPVMVVLIPYPGASPETVEREIVNRVEKALQSIPQVYMIRSTASESTAQIVIIFNFKKNMVEASDEIRNAIASVRHKLPVEMREPILRRIDPAAARSCSWHSPRTPRAMPRSRAWPRTWSPTASARSMAWPSST